MFGRRDRSSDGSETSMTTVLLLLVEVVELALDLWGMEGCR